MDCTHFITKDKIIFTTRGNIHPKNYVRAAVLYIPNESGVKILDGQAYEKCINETGENLKYKIKPQYLKNDKTGKYIIIPKKDIVKTFSPFDRKIKDKIFNELRSSKWKELLEELKQIVPIEDIGFIGSYLIGFQNSDSDLDIIIKGSNNLYKIQKNFNAILKKLNGKNNLNSKIFKISLEKYYSIYNRTTNDFSSMIKRRWPTISTANFTLKLRFSLKDDETNKYKFRKKKGTVEIVGLVTNDAGTNFMPRTFSLISNGKNYTAITYFWDYAYCVKTGDRVIVNAFLFNDNLLLISDVDKHGIKFKDQ